MKQNYLKSLFLMLMMCVGMSAWADEVQIYLNEGATGTSNGVTATGNVNTNSANGNPGNSFANTSASNTTFTFSGFDVSSYTDLKLVLDVKFTYPATVTTYPYVTVIAYKNNVQVFNDQTSIAVDSKVSNYNEYTVNITDDFDKIELICTPGTGKSNKGNATTTYGTYMDNVKVLGSVEISTPTVTAPIFDVKAGTYTEDQLVLIDNYNSDYIYAYTIDGTDPTIDAELNVTNGTEYDNDEGIEITSSCTLKVIAVDEDGNASSITSAAYVIQPKLTSIAVSGTPSKVTYKDGETFDPTGLVVTGTYSDNNTGDLTSQASFNCTPSTMALGTTTVSVIATVNEVSSEAYNVSVTVNPNKDYVELPWTWEGGVKADLTAIEGVTGFGLGSDYATGNAPYRVKLDGTGDYIMVKTNEEIGICTIKVKMLGGNSTSSIAVQGSADGTNFTTVETLTIAGEANAELELKTSGDLGAKYRYVKFLFTKGSNVGVGGISIDKADGTTIDVTNVESIEVTGTPEVFWKGDAFNSNGMSVTATYNNGETEVIDNAKCTFSGHKQNTPGLQTITVSYEGATDTYEIEVKTIANTQETAYTTAQAIALIDAGKDLSTEVYVTGVVSKVDKLGTSGGITFWISEDGTITDQFEMYYCMNLDGQNFEDVDDIETGATIVAYGKIMYFKNSNVYEMNAGKLVSYTAPVHETATITLNDACHDADGMVYGTYSNASAWVVPEDLIVSVIAVEDGSLLVESFNEGEVVPANTGVMVSAMEGGNYTITLSNKYGVDPLEGAYENALRPSGNGITSEAMANADANCTYYRLTMHNGTQIGYWWGAADGAAFSLAANKAYLAVPKAAGVKANMWIGGDEDPIKSVEKEYDTVIYDMQGRKVSKAQKGLYIVNGKKVVR